MQQYRSISTDSDGLFHYFHCYSEHPKFVSFDLHTHNDYEVYILLQGDVHFLVEGAAYQLNPYDILIIHGNELHQVFHQSDVPYERIVLNLSDRFFDQMECPEYRSALCRRLIPAEKGKNLGVFEILERLERYAREENENNTLVRCAIIELMYAFSKLPKEAYSHRHEPEIVRYINEHLSEPLTLECLAGHFFLSKYYLCRLFKKTTGFTVNQYIVAKRLLLAKQLVSDGKSLAEASAGAGFGCYENFYKAYVKAYGRSPREGLSGMRKKPVI